MAIIIGIDLAGSEKRDTGFCIIKNGKASVAIVHKDSELLARIRACSGKKLIGIDAPLSLPKGRKSLEKRSSIHFRKCDLALRKLGIRFFPITLGPMRMLTKRGMVLKRKIMRAERGALVFEVYPGATYDVFGIARKDRPRIMKWIEKSVKFERRTYTQDELDAVAAAITIVLHLKNKSLALGDKKEGQIIIPASRRIKYKP